MTVDAIGVSAGALLGTSAKLLPLLKVQQVWVLVAGTGLTAVTKAYYS